MYGLSSLIACVQTSAFMSVALSKPHALIRTTEATPLSQSCDERTSLRREPAL